MRKLTVVVVAAMILLAGCSGGGGGAASPTEESETDAPATGTPMENATSNDSMEPATPTEPTTPDDDDDAADDDTQSGDTNPRSVASESDPLEEATEIEGTTYNGTSEATAVIRNDTSNNRELIEYTDESGTTSEVYNTEDYVAYRNGTTGEVQYGGADSFVGGGVQFAAGFTALGPLFYVGLVEWEQTGTTTVDGEDALVYEGDSLNQTAFDEGQLTSGQFGQGEVQSVDGRIVVGSNGRVYSSNVEIETQDGTYGGDMSVSYDDITVTQPGWVDESQAP